MSSLLDALRQRVYLPRHKTTTEWQTLDALYRPPSVRRDGRWLRPLLPEGATPVSTALLFVLSTVMLWCVFVSLPSFMRHDLQIELVGGVFVSATATFLLVYWLSPGLRRLWYVYPFLALAIILPLNRYAPAVLPAVWNVIVTFAREVWVTLGLLAAGQAELIPVPVSLFFAILALWGYLWLLLATAWRRPWVMVFVLAGTLLFVWQWAFYFDPAFGLGVTFLAAGALTMAVRHEAVFYAEWSHAAERTGRSSSERTLRPIVVYSITFVLLVTAFAQLLPADISPLDTGRVGKWFERIVPILGRLRGGGTSGDARFSLARTGFSSGDQRLGGPIVLDDSQVLTVAVEGRELPGSLYLRGAVSDMYTGSGWQRAPQPTLQFSEGDSLPDPQFANLPSTDVEVSIQYDGLETTSLFEPWAPRGIRHFDPAYEQEYTATPALDLWGARVFRTGQQYLVETEIPLYVLQQLRNLSVDDRSYMVEDAADLAPAAAVFGDEQYLRRYLQLPSTFPGKIRELARAIVRDQADLVDQALALTDYVRNNYPYTLEPPEVPSGTDFVEHFLFSAQQGYCTYHSTALAVMLRAIDIPSRWVIGYVVEDPDNSTLQSDTPYTVTNASAHAWVEAFIPGYGWLSLDPTPRFSGFERVEGLPEIQDTGENTPVTPGGDSGAIRPDAGRMDGFDEGTDNAGGEVTPSRPPWFYWVVALGALLVLFLVRAGLVLFHSYRADRAALSSDAGPLGLFLHARCLLSQLGVSLGDHMTAREVLRQVTQHPSNAPEVTVALQSLVPVLEQDLYGGIAPTREQLLTLDRNWQAATRGLRRSYGILTMIRARLLATIRPR